MIMAEAISMVAALVLIAALVNLALAGAAISLNGLQLLRRKHGQVGTHPRCCGRQGVGH
ncbi:MAG: hypothetical protein ACJLS3_12285 [Erythrobacter sp.]